MLRSALEHRDALDDAAFAVDLARGVEFVEALVAVMQRNEARRPLVEALAGSAAQGAAPGHPAHEHMRRRYARLVARMHEALQELERDDRLAAGVDPKAAARVIVALMDGLQVQWLYSLDASGPRPLDMAAHLGTYLRLVTE
ncbi:TetR family transcriptional regulator C-terminal domain-containing protein [Puerhibacterium sp. TATVAM-FAB25]|uniref:TetR family transcriptional regulator C-terminal domain-containing protein n=1 Tax=Puerhibacterium sp. TATVAM-FAB25 TaxID=3093699 RepID=UPI003979D69D